MTNNIRTMELLGVDYWDRPVYKYIETGILWKDITLGSENPELCSCQNSFEGEPDNPIKSDLEIHFKTKYSEDKNKFNYMMLSRLQTDCKYYLGNGNRNKENLWAGDEQKQINEMKKLYNKFTEDDKPEWLTYEQILDYEKSMVSEKLFCSNCQKSITPITTEYEEGLEGFESGKFCHVCEEYID